MQGRHRGISSPVRTPYVPCMPPPPTSLLCSLLLFTHYISLLASIHWHSARFALLLIAHCSLLITHYSLLLILIICLTSSTW
ncbi:hypothetical protein EV356DRAFT_267447 [Viridothelium virens]|uniref:Uncharacterized protein n=1 Tax=Viridothelium virens TaxID=1048519 RepID=A0A6A6HMG6_VIRVR|nr:hypothetical protein EV356DRAFT_267447 [Viridothelium virens]